MADGLAVAADVDLVVVVLRGLAVHGVVEVHALGVLAPPVAPDQVAAGAEQADDHCGKDRDCMCLTHTHTTTHGGSVNTAQGTQSGALSTHTHTPLSHFPLCTEGSLFPVFTLQTHV